MRNKFLFILLACIVLFSCTRRSGPNSRASNSYYRITKDITEDISVPKDSESDIDYYVTVVKVVDGDTFDGLTQDDIEIRFRIHGIDAPEIKQDFSVKTKEKLSNLIFGKRVGIKVQKKRDGYGRPVVLVSTSECDDVGAELLRSGMAWHSKKYDDSEFYDKLEKEARRNKIGLWSINNPTPPWEYRN